MKFLVTSHLPDDFDPSEVTEEMASEIHALNAEIEAAGAMLFAGGLHPASSAKTVRAQPDGKALITDGPYMETKEHLGGLLIVEAESLDQVLEWARRGAAAGGRPVEVREIFFHEG